MNRNRTYITIFITAIYTFIGLLVHFFLTPYITNNIGIESYGFVILSKTITSYIIIISSAFNSFAARYISISYNKNDIEIYHSYCSTVFWGNVFLSIIVIVFGFLFILFAELFINIPLKIINDVKSLLIITFISFTVNLLSTVYVSTAYVKNRLDIANIIKVISYVIEAFILLIMFSSFKPHICYVGIASLLSYLCIFWGNRYLTYKIIPNFNINIKYFSFVYLKELFINGMWNSLNNLGNTLNSGLDLLVTNLYLSVIGMGQISIAKSFSSIMSATISIMSTPFQPVYLKLYSKDNINALIEEMRFSSKICSGAVCLVFSIFVSFGKEFLYLWIPKQDINLIYWLCIITLFTCVIESPIYPYHYTYTLTLKNRIPCIITIVGGFLNVLGMYILLKYTKIGVYSIVLTTLVIMSIIELITNPLYVAKCLKINKWLIYKSIIFAYCICLEEISLCMLYKFFVGSPTNWFMIIINGFTCAFLCILVTTLIIFGYKQSIIKFKFFINNKKTHE